jgi:hypothetical protein
MLMPAIVGCGSFAHSDTARIADNRSDRGCVRGRVADYLIVLGAAVMRNLGNWAWIVPVTLALGITV